MYVYNVYVKIICVLELIHMHILLSACNILHSDYFILLMHILSIACNILYNNYFVLVSFSH